jgi:hypothetical protein
MILQVETQNLALRMCDSIFYIKALDCASFQTARMAEARMFE